MFALMFGVSAHSIGPALPPQIGYFRLDSDKLAVLSDGVTRAFAVPVIGMEQAVNGKRPSGAVESKDEPDAIGHLHITLSSVTVDVTAAVRSGDPALKHSVGVDIIGCRCVCACVSVCVCLRVSECVCERVRTCLRV